MASLLDWILGIVQIIKYFTGYHEFSHVQTSIYAWSSFKREQTFISLGPATQPSYKASLTTVSNYARQRCAKVYGTECTTNVGIALKQYGL